MNSDIPHGITRWTPSVTQMQDQWTVQNPGIARGKVWQPKLAPPPPNPFPPTKIENGSINAMEDNIQNGFPLDLSTLRSSTLSSRQAESPLDLSLKTRKRCADSTLQFYQYPKIAKKVSAPLHTRGHTSVHDQTLSIQHGVVDGPTTHAERYISNVEQIQQHENTISNQHRRGFNQNSYSSMSVLKHEYNASKHIGQTIDHAMSDQNIMRQRYHNTGLNRQYSTQIIHTYGNDVSKSSQHLPKRTDQARSKEIAKYQTYPINIEKEPEYSQQFMLYNGTPELMQGMKKRLSKTAEEAHMEIMSQVTKSSPSQRYITAHKPPSYHIVDVGQTDASTHVRSAASTSSLSTPFQNRPSVLSGGLRFKQQQECCSPDSTITLSSTADLIPSRGHLQNIREISQNKTYSKHFEISQNKTYSKHFEIKQSKVLNSSYVPSSSPSNCLLSSSISSSKKSPSFKSVSNIYSSSVQDTKSMQNTFSEVSCNSIVMKTGGSVIKDVKNETIIRNSRPRLWNRDQLKQNQYKQELMQSQDKEFQDQPLSKNSMHNETQFDSKSEFISPLEINIPLSKQSDTKSQQRPKPFSKKHIIMNAFRNDESMKHILDDQTNAVHASQKESSQPLHNSSRLRKEAPTGMSSEYPDMPTLSPQAKLPAPKISPPTREPPTLDIASLQDNKRKQKISPKSSYRQSYEIVSDTANQDYSIQPQSSFPQRANVPFKRIPIANVAPMIHGKCASSKTTQETEKESLNHVDVKNDLKQTVSTPVQQNIIAFRVNAIVDKNIVTPDCKIESSYEDRQIIEKQKQKIKHKNCNSARQPMNPKKLKTNKIGDLDNNSSKNRLKQHQLKRSRIKNNSLRPNNHSVRSKPTITSSTKRKADEIRRRVRERKAKVRQSGSNGISISQISRLHNSPKRFQDFEPEVLNTRTRRKSAGRRGYHRNEAYEKELWRDENRRAFRNRLRARKFKKGFGNTSNTIPDLKDKESIVPIAESLDEQTNNEIDDSGTWEVKNTSTKLRNGKSKGMSMKILFKPPEERLFRRRIRRRGKIRYGLRKTISAPSNLIAQYQRHIYEEIGDPQAKPHFSGEEVEYSQYEYDHSDAYGHCFSTSHMPILPEVKKLSVCKDTGETILHRAARMGHEEVALSYLQTGLVDVNVKDNAGYTPLHESCVNGNMVIARTLLSYGAEVNCASQDGIRPIHDAVDNDFVSLVRLLLSYGADPTISTYGGKTPLKIAHSQNMRSLIEGYLGDINGFDDGSETVWEFCRYQKNDACEENDLFDQLPSDPEIEGEIFEETETPLLHKFTIVRSKTNERSNVVLLKDLSEYLHIKTGDIMKEKTVKAAVIEDGRESLKQSADKSCYFERLYNIIDSSCRLFPTNDVPFVFSKFDTKKSLKKCIKHTECIVSDKTKRKFTDNKACNSTGATGKYGQSTSKM